MFGSVLVANRGEIAVRVVRTLRKMGIRAVVAASIPDRRSLAVREADAMVLLEGYSAAETYLNMDAIIAAAQREWCEAVHPGYGFLSERPEFAERCAAAGLTFIGPSPATLRLLGDKAAARQLAVANGVPVVPGWDGADDDATLRNEAQRLGFPVMVKARGGGGGRGMRAVEGPEALPEALASARREAQAAFGDPTLLLETLVTAAHHVEVQVLADAHGGLVHLGERDCSVQRRRQKLIEETPSPIVDDVLRGRLTAAALRIARAANYLNAGTVEFLVGAPDPGSGARPFYFLEVNPRLQVEHPVTEMVTGLDLVELQLRVAAGEPLPFRQEDVRFTGHAIEFRVNAEDPFDDFRPSSGRLQRVFWGGALARFDRGYGAGDEVPPQFDSLLAKAVVHTSEGDRADVISFAECDLDDSVVEGVRTNLELLIQVARHPDFVHGGVDTGWLERVLPNLLAGSEAPPAAWAAVAAALVAPGPALSNTPFGRAGWLGAGASAIWLSDGNSTRTLTARGVGSGACEVEMDGGSVAVRIVRGQQVDEAWSHEWDVHVAGFDRTLSVRLLWPRAYCDVEGIPAAYRFEIVPPPPLPRRAASAEAGALTITAPLAGTIASLRVTEGDVIEAGQLVALLEAMKMEHRITATAGGTVHAIHVRERDIVTEGQLLVELTV